MLLIFKTVTQVTFSKTNFQKFAIESTRKATEEHLLGTKTSDRFHKVGTKCPCFLSV